MEKSVDKNVNRGIVYLTVKHFNKNQMFKLECLKCDGTGEIRWAKHVQNGICFSCGGKGHVLRKGKRKPPPTTKFKVFMIQEGKPVHCGFQLTKRSAKKWLELPGERWFEEVPR